MLHITALRQTVCTVMCKRPYWLCVSKHHQPICMCAVVTRQVSVTTHVERWREPEQKPPRRQIILASVHRLYRSASSSMGSALMHSCHNLTLSCLLSAIKDTLKSDLRGHSVQSETAIHCRNQIGVTFKTTSKFTLQGS